MAKVLFKGLSYELQKISLTKLFRYKMNLPLDIAKSKTDALLDGEQFVIETESIEQAEELELYVNEDMAEALGIDPDSIQVAE